MVPTAIMMNRDLVNLAYLGYPMTTGLSGDRASGQSFRTSSAGLKSAGTGSSIVGMVRHLKSILLVVLKITSTILEIPTHRLSFQFHIWPWTTEESRWFAEAQKGLGRLIPLLVRSNPGPLWVLAV